MLKKKRTQNESMNLKVKLKTIKVLKDNVEVNLCDLGLGKYFSDTKIKI